MEDIAKTVFVLDWSSTGKQQRQGVLVDATRTLQPTPETNAARSQPVKYRP